jgi:hypothetical protein
MPPDQQSSREGEQGREVPFGFSAGDGVVVLGLLHGDSLLSFDRIRLPKISFLTQKPPKPVYSIPLYRKIYRQSSGNFDQTGRAFSAV